MKTPNQLHLECTIRMLEEILNEVKNEKKSFEEIIERLIKQAQSMLGYK